MGRLFFVCCMALLVIGNSAYCQNELMPRILFASYHVNYAWGFVFKGITIDSEGNVAAFEYTPQDLMPGFIDGKVSPDYLKTLFSQGRKIIAKIPRDELEKMIALIPATRGSAMSEPEVFSEDRGTYATYAYLADATDNLLEPILLAEEGDGGDRNNMTQESAKIMNWINNLKLAGEGNVGH